jgi:hypothetical protein
MPISVMYARDFLILDYNINQDIAVRETKTRSYIYKWGVPENWGDL